MSGPNRTRTTVLSAIAAGVLCLAAVPAAQAAVTANPGSVTFPERSVGSTSDPQLVTVTVVCNNFGLPGPACQSNDTFVRNPQFFGANPGDFFADGGGNCPPVVVLSGGAPAAQCTITIRFKPTGVGDRSATLLVGTSNSGGPNAIVVSGKAVPTGERAAALAKCKKKKTKKKRKACKARAKNLPE